MNGIDWNTLSVCLFVCLFLSVCVSPSGMRVERVEERMVD